ncbi:MAG: glutathionylspermidine synthase family protein [Bacillota bacterium]
MSCLSLIDGKHKFNKDVLIKIIEVVKHPKINYYCWDQTYMVPEPFKVDLSLLDEVKIATEICGTIYQKAVRLVLYNDSLLKMLCIPEEAIKFCKHKYDSQMPVTLIGRFDFGLHKGKELKLLEFNSDTPTGVVEASELNSIFSEINNGLNPNCIFLINVKEAFNLFLQNKQYNNIVFTSLDWYFEDKGTVLAEMDYSGLKAKYVPLDKLIVKEDGLYDDLEQKIDLLYRLYPIEWFLQEEDGEKLINLVVTDKLDILNPPTAYIAQSKIMQAVIWELGNTDNNYFTKEEKEVVKKYFLPTYLERDRLIGRAYVSKPAYGREGGGICLYDKYGKKEREIKNKETSYEYIHQEKIELSDLTVRTWMGDFLGKITIGSFIIGGKSSGLYLRVGEEITDDNSYYLPVILKESEAVY